MTARRVAAAAYGFVAVLLSTGAARGQVVTEFGAGISPSAGVRGITAGPDGNLWFTESNLDKIGQITPLGVVTELRNSKRQVSIHFPKTHVYDLQL